MRVLAVIAYLLCLAAPAAAEYISQEIIIIPWGNETNQLPVAKATREGLIDTPEDSTDDIVFPGLGPSQGFVDNIDNIYINSTTLGTFKKFDKNGNAIADYSAKKAGVNTEFYSIYISDFYIDSMGLFYLVDFDDTDFIAVADQNNNLVDRLNPHGMESGVGICCLSQNSDDVITVSTDSGYYTYRHGEFSEGGDGGAWLAKDEYYYAISAWEFYDPARLGVDSITFIKSRDPDINGNPSWVEKHQIPMMETISNAHLIGVSDDMRIFVRVSVSRNVRFVQVYDTSFQLLDQFQIAPANEDYLLPIGPFMRHDGTVYEFPQDDDGLHVVRWSKQ